MARFLLTLVTIIAALYLVLRAVYTLRRQFRAAQKPPPRDPPRDPNVIEGQYTEVDPARTKDSEPRS